MSDINKDLMRLATENCELKKKLEALAETNGTDITLRDRFALAALSGALESYIDTGESSELYAKWAYELADAMLEARAAHRSD